MKIKVGVPFAKHGRITDPTIQSLKALEQCDDMDVELAVRQSSNLPRARNAMINNEASQLVHQSLPGFDYFLSVDADSGFTPDNVRQLIAHDLDIVSGAYLQKYDAACVVAGWFSEVEGISRLEDRVQPDATGLMEVDWVGAGFLLIKREVLEKLAYPWFTTMELHYDTPQGRAAQITSDDLGFCIKARQQGFKIFLDADCRVDHVPHPNEPGGMSLSMALNELLRSREAIVRHVTAMDNDNKRLRQLVKSLQANGK